MGVEETVSLAEVDVIASSVPWSLFQLLNESESFVSLVHVPGEIGLGQDFDFFFFLLYQINGLFHSKHLFQYFLKYAKIGTHKPSSQTLFPVDRYSLLFAYWQLKVFAKLKVIAD